MSDKSVPLFCRFGGDFVEESKICYTGGCTRVVRVDPATCYKDLLSEVTTACGSPSSSGLEMKYRYPGLELDSSNLVCISHDQDVRNMIMAFEDINGISRHPLEIFINAKTSTVSAAQSIPMNLERTLLDGANEGDKGETLARGETFISCLQDPQDGLAEGPRNPFEQIPIEPVNQELPKFLDDELPTSSSTLKVGLEFPDLAALKLAVHEDSICQGIKLKRLKTDKMRYTIGCADENCSGRMHARKIHASGTFQIRSLQKHTCVALPESINKQATTKWISNFIMVHHKENQEIKDIIKDIKSRYGIDLSYNKVWKARDLARKEMQQMQSEPMGKLLEKVPSEERAIEIGGHSQDVAYENQHRQLLEMGTIGQGDAVDKEFEGLGDLSKCIGTIGQGEHLASGKNHLMDGVFSQDVVTEFGGQSQDLDCGENQHGMLSEIDQNPCEELSEESLTGSDSMEMNSFQLEKVGEYCKKILETNPGSVANFSKTGDEFRLFVAYSASLHSYRQSRPIICIESEKRTIYPYAVYVALGVDGEGNTFPLSIGVSEAETKESWSWFCTELKGILKSTSSTRLTVTIDSEKKLLYEAINNVFPNAYIFYHPNHLISQCQCVLEKDSRFLMAEIYKASFAETKEDFDHQMKEIRTKSIEAYDWLCKKNPKHWSATHFWGELPNWTHRLDEFLDTIGCLGMPIVSMMEEIRVKAANLYRARYRYSLKWVKNVNDSKSSKILLSTWDEDLDPKFGVDYSRSNMLLMNSLTVFDIENRHKRYDVDLEKQTCSCGYWQRVKIPCDHAVRALLHQNLDPSDYYHETYRLSQYKETYSKSFYPVLKSNQLEKVGEYCKKILETNPGSVAKFSKTGDEFRLFVAYHASLHSYRQSRPIVYIESEKRTAFPYAVYFAFGADGEDKKFPLSIGVCEAETKESWLWFCTELRSILKNTSSTRLTVSIDSEKKLLSEAIKNVFPDAYIFYDLKHLISQVVGCDQEIDTEYLVLLICEASIAETREDWNDRMDEISGLSKKAYDWLCNKNPGHWSHSYFEGERRANWALDSYSFLDLELVGECSIYDLEEKLDSHDHFFWTIICVLDSPILSMMEEIRVKAANLYQKRYQDSLEWVDTLVFSAARRHRDFLESVKEFKVQKISELSVFSIESNFDDKRYDVDLEKQTCSCRRWQVQKIPCRHAVATLRHQNLDPLNYYHGTYSVSQYKDTYSKSFELVGESVKVLHSECHCRFKYGY